MRRQRPTTDPTSKLPRPTRRIHEETPGKQRELLACPECGSSYRNGRWTSKPAPVGSSERICPACERIADHYPAGRLDLEGDFALQHREEIEHLMRHVEERERAQHPLKRIMAIEAGDGGFGVLVTDAKLTESLGRAVEKAYGGQLDESPHKHQEGNLVRVHWRRDA